MKATIEVEYDQVDSIVKQEMVFMIECFENDLERVKEKNTGYVFLSDKEEDIKEIKKHIKAFKRVLTYYGGVL